MSSMSADSLYALLPSVYRIRDEQQGRPLHALVSLIAAELEAIEENVEQLYDDQFIETCESWVAPYIGELVGYRPLHEVAEGAMSRRAEIANTIAYRRRKGTAAMLEQLARDVTGWLARAVEFFEQLATTQYMNHVRLHAPATADLRSTPRMRRIGGAFNAVAHTAEMRSPERACGRYNIRNVGIFLWRFQPCRLSDVPLTAHAGDAAGRKWRFNPLGADQRLFREPESETVISHIAQPANVPDALDVRLGALGLEAASPDATLPNDYGEGASLVLSRPNTDPTQPPVAVAADRVCLCDLSDSATGWAHEDTVDADTIAIDPRLGRALFGANVTGPVLATFRTAFSRAIGGGEYARTVGGDTLATQEEARAGEALQPHLDAIAAGGRLVIGDSLTYAETPVFKVDGVTAAGAAGHEVVVTARDGARPLIAAGGTIAVEIGARGSLVLEGLVISGGALEVAATADDEPRQLVLRHCTLVPGVALNPDASAVSPGAPSLVIASAGAQVRLEHCVVGGLRVAVDATVEIADSIVDAGAADGVAYESNAAASAGGDLTISDSTVIGKVRARVMSLASNTLFFAQLAGADTWKAPVWAERKQEGCVRFSFVPEGSLVPKRFRCVPDETHPDVLPHFTSLRYGDPGYAQLRTATDRAIREGASDEGEIGAMHALYQPQREANLRRRLDEYLRFGLRAGIFYVT